MRLVALILNYLKRQVGCRLPLDDKSVGSDFYQYFPRMFFLWQDGSKCDATEMKNQKIFAVATQGSSRCAFCPDKHDSCARCCRSKERKRCTTHPLWRNSTRTTRGIFYSISNRYDPPEGMRKPSCVHRWRRGPDWRHKKRGRGDDDYYYKILTWWNSDLVLVKSIFRERAKRALCL